MKGMRNRMPHFLLKDFSSAAAAARSAPDRDDTSQFGQDAEATKQRRRQSGQCIRLTVSPFTELSRAGRRRPSARKRRWRRGAASALPTHGSKGTSSPTLLRTPRSCDTAFSSSTSSPRVLRSVKNEQGELCAIN